MLPNSSNPVRAKSSPGPLPRRILFISLLVLTLAALTSKFWPRLSLLSHHLTLPKTLATASKMSTYSKELEVAQLAVQRATLLTKKVFHEKAKGTISKDDASPVTIGDFGAQALIIHAIKKNFPDDEIVGEEEASSLRENRKLWLTEPPFPTQTLRRFWEVRSRVSTPCWTQLMLEIVLEAAKEEFGP
jgi:hypothetical protein